jgi:tetratricopeptide (TPR) repeat protein
LAAGLALRIGFVHRDLGDLVAARRYFRRARQLFEAGGQRGGRAQALAAEGWVTLRLGDRDAAAALARASIALADGPGRITGLVTLGVALAAGGPDETDESRRVLRAALNLAEEHRLPHHQALCHNAAGIALRTAGDFGAALDQHRLALELLRPLSEVQLEIDCLYAYAETCRAAGRPEQARPLLDRIVGLARELGRPYDEERAGERAD